MGLTKISIDFSEIEAIMESELLKIGKEAQKDVKKNTPELTGDLEDEINLSDIQKTGNKISIEVYTDLSVIPYAEIVENGVRGKKFQYHKPAGVPFGPKQVGAKMYEKVATEFQRTGARLV